MIQNLTIDSKSFPCGVCGLGDLIAIFYGLENTGIQNSISFEIKLLNCDVSFFNNFNFKKIYLTNKSGFNLIEQIIKHTGDPCCKLGLFNGKFFIDSFLCFLKKEYSYDPFLSKPVELKNKNLLYSTEDYASVQFDSRSAMRKRTLSINKIKKILKKESNWFCLGGPDTKKYLGENVNYSIGNIDYIIKKLYNSKKFIGSDSGISHLAGLAGIKSNIYIKDYCGCLEAYYNQSYRECVVYNITKKFYYY